LPLAPETDLHLAEVRIAALRHDAHPGEAVMIAIGAHVEELFQPAVTGQQAGRRRRQRGRGGLHGHLVEIAIVEPEILAVRDHELRRLLPSRGVDRRQLPAEFARPLDDETAVGALHFGAATIGNLLRELGTQRAHAG
jgi:hypothetical protein